MKQLVVDSWAILAFLHKEKTYENIKEIFTEAHLKKTKLFLSIINLAEVYYKLIRSVGHEKALLTVNSLKEIPMEIIPAADETVYRAAEIKAGHSISLGDCFAVVLAQELKATILTGDREFKKVKKLVKISWL